MRSGLWLSSYVRLCKNHSLDLQQLVWIELLLHPTAHFNQQSWSLRAAKQTFTVLRERETVRDFSCLRVEVSSVDSIKDVCLHLRHSFSLLYKHTDFVSYPLFLFSVLYSYDWVPELFYIYNNEKYIHIHIFAAGVFLVYSGECVPEVGRVLKNCTQVKVKVLLEIFTQVKVIVWIVTWVRVKKYWIKNYSSS